MDCPVCGARGVTGPLWDNDPLQFARLLCEIRATQVIDEYELGASMDLTGTQIEELFDRAHKAFEEAKRDYLS